MPTNEAGLVEAIRRAIVRTHPQAWIFKVAGSPGQVSGVPDLLVCVQGRLIGIEAKHQRPGESHAHALGRATPQQRDQIARINAAGGRADVVTSVEAALALVAEALGKPTARELLGLGPGTRGVSALDNHAYLG